MRYINKITAVFIAAVVSGVFLISSSALAASSHNKPVPTPPAPTLSLPNNILFVSNRTKHYEIYEKNLATGVIIELTSGSSDSMNPELSPDGTDIVFYSDRSGTNQIYTLNVQTPSVVTQLTHTTGGINDYDPTYTTDGTNILYKQSNSNGSYGDIWEMMNLNGSDPHDLTPTLTTSKIEGWKPTAVSATEIIFTERLKQGNPYTDNLYSLNLTTGATVALTNNALTNWYPDYSPVLGKVVFITKQSRNSDDVLDTMNIDGTGRTTLITQPGDNDDPSWSTDGKYLVFLNDNSGSYNVYAANSDGSDITLIDQSPRNSNDLSPLMLP